MAELEIGIFKSGRRAYGFDDIAIVPSRRTRDPEDVDISWQIDAYRFELPLLASAMDGVVSPATAIEIGRLGGLGVLNLEGLWTRYEDPSKLFDEIRELPAEKATARMQQMYAEPVDMDLVTQRIQEMKAAGITTAASVTPQKTEAFAKALLAAELDILVIQGTVVSAEHVSKTVEPLNLKRFIREFEVPVIVGGCASYQAGLHLMRTGAVGVLVGVGPGNACTTRGVLGIGVPQATAIADVAGARMRHLDETGVYCHVIADGGMAYGGDLAKAIACGADACMVGSPLAKASEAKAKAELDRCTANKAQAGELKTALDADEAALTAEEAGVKSEQTEFTGKYGPYFAWMQKQAKDGGKDGGPGMDAEAAAAASFGLAAWLRALNSGKYVRAAIRQPARMIGLRRRSRPTDTASCTESASDIIPRLKRSFIAQARLAMSSDSAAAASRLRKMAWPCASSLRRAVSSRSRTRRDALFSITRFFSSSIFSSSLLVRERYMRL